MSNFGTCMAIVWTSQGPDLNFTPATGLDVYLQSLMCRLTTPHGSVMGCPNDCLDVRDFVGAGMTQTDVQRAQAKVNAQVQRDERTLTSDTRATYDTATRKLTIAITGTTAAGPYKLTLAVGSVDITILNASAN